MHASPRREVGAPRRCAPSLAVAPRSCRPLASTPRPVSLTGVCHPGSPIGASALPHVAAHHLALLPLTRLEEPRCVSRLPLVPSAPAA
jgi:hypothetical protein